MKRFWCVWAVATLGGLIGLGCSNDSSKNAHSCTPGATNCVTDTIGTVCPQDGAEELSFSCDPGQTCQKGACVGGSCTAGDKQCVTPNLSRVCTTDGAWLPFACAAQSSCVSGECVPDADASAPDAGTSDGSTGDAGDAGACACADDELCRNGQCVATSAACTPGSGICAGADALYQCQSSGQGYTKSVCPATAPCSDGACRGPVCNAGETKCEEIGSTMSTPFDHMLSCVDGTKWEITRCGASQLCAYNLDRETRDHDLAILNDPSSNEPIVIPPGVGASCRDVNCTYDRVTSALPYAFSCGDPADLTVDPLHTYSWCTSAPPIVSVEWVNYDCSPGSVCIDSLYGCGGSCTQGDTRCAGDLLETCGADGTFGPATACTDGLVCGYPFQQDAGTAQCMDPVCAAWHFFGPYPYQDPPLQYGECTSSSQVRLCMPDGTLGPAQDCFAGTCSPFGTAGSGVTVGGCVTDCSEGDARCLGDAPNTLPFIQNCVAGKWVTTACPDNLACLFGPDGPLCGVCSPGAKRCNDDDSGTELCNANGQWDPATPCAVGKCDFSNTCVTACTPNAVYCGTSHYSTNCSATGVATYGQCADGTLCRDSANVSSDGTSYIGCVECLGPTQGGNSGFGLADSKCPDATHIATCGNDDKWQAPVACPPGTTCVASSIDDGSTLAGCVANPAGQ